MANSNQTSLDGDVKVGSTEIEAVQADDDREIIGYICPFTIGNDFVVPRGWLEEKADELNLSPAILPNPVSQKRAFTRAGNRVDGSGVATIEKNEDVEVNLEKTPYERRYEVEIHDRREEESFDGDVVGVISYDPERGSLDLRPLVKPDDEMWQTWNEYVSAFKDEFDLMCQSNLGEDIRHMIVNVFHSQSQSVKFRAGGGVYFAPVAAEEVVNSLAELMTMIDREQKSAGFPCELDAIDVADSEEKRSMVEEKVRRNLEEQVSELVQEAVDELADDDTLVEELLAELRDELSDVEEFADKYNALLDAEMTVREYLEEWKLQVTGQAESLVDDALDELEDEDQNDVRTI